jgi:predicted transglutaminase-like cysteine proteinase
MRWGDRAQALAVLIFAAAACVIPAAAADAASGFFGEDAIPQTAGMQRFDKWTEMLVRYKQEEPLNTKKPCVTERIDLAGTPRPVDFCKLGPWLDFIRKVKLGTFSVDMLTEVNRFLNKFPYVEDITNFGVKDFWTTTQEFINFSGDCEDYAIAKYYTLKALGFDPASMRIVAVMDMNLGLGHAILAVHFKDENYILDNQFDGATQASRIKHYQAVYSINETQWWKHIQAIPGLTR